MQTKTGIASALVAAGVILKSTVANAAPDKAALDKAITGLKTFDFGADRNEVEPIADAVVAQHGNVEANQDLERRLAGVLKEHGTRDGKDYACRVLRIIGTAESVPVLAGLLGEKNHSHMARYALQSIPAPEAAAALRDSLGKVKGPLLIGVIGSVGCRRDAESVAALTSLLVDEDKAVAAAAAQALGSIGTPPAAKALAEAAGKSHEGEKIAVADAALACAERLLASGDKGEAVSLYKSLTSESQPKHVRVAAAKGMLAVAGKKD